MIFAAAFMLLYNASTFAAQISNEFFYNQFYSETGIGSRVSFESNYPLEKSYISVGDEMYWLQRPHVGDGFGHFCHQYPLELIMILIFRIKSILIKFVTNMVAAYMLAGLSAPLNS